MQNYNELKRKADGGDIMAQLTMAEAYFNGDVNGTPELSNGLKYMGMAASSGNPAVQHMYASMLSNLSMDNEAFVWYKKAASNNNPESQSKLSWCYFTGTGTGKDDKLAFTWAEKAIKNGEEKESCFILGVLYLQGKAVKSDAVQAYKMFKKSAAQGNRDALDAIAKLEAQIPQLKKM